MFGEVAMRSAYLLIGVTLTSYTVFSQEDSPPSYLITAANRFIPGRQEKVCIELINTTETMQLDFILSEQWIPRSWRTLPDGVSNRTLDQLVVNISPEEGSKCMSMTAPKDVINRSRNEDPDHLLLQVRGTVAGTGGSTGWRFDDSMKIKLLNRWYDSDLTFVQTDKPVYKPGQLELAWFIRKLSSGERVLTLDTQLRPTTDMIDIMYITSPSKVRVEQWNNVTMEKGMKQFKFQLVDEPTLGTYTITMERNGDKSTATFVVREYVLPKYEVTITPPKYITFQSERVVAEVCAKYTFGQPVKGTTEGTVCVKENRFSPIIFRAGAEEADDDESDGSSEGAYCTSVNIPLVDGCSTIDVSKSDVGYDRYTKFRYGVRLEISARVKEQGTGTYLNASTQTLNFQQYDIRLKAQGPDRYKPGLPYNGQVMVERLDGKPVSGEKISVEISNWRYSTYSKNYTSDENGVVKFSLPPVADDIPNFSISIRAVNYASEFWSWNSPSAYLYVRGWYSPSGSFLQIQPKSETLSCGSTVTFKVQYTTSIALDTELRYKVVGTGDIVAEGSKPLSLNLNTGISEPDDSEEWDKSSRSPCFYSLWRCPIILEDNVVAEKSSNETTTDAETTTTEAPDTEAPDDEESEEGESKAAEPPTLELIDSEPLSIAPAPVPIDETIDQVTATHKGSFTVDVEITPEMSKSGLIVVYYVRPDGEVVADGIQLKVEACTKNEAEMTFSKSESRPGDTVDLRFKASPGSLCSYGIVDKSVFLEGGNNQLTIDKALSSIQNLALREWSGVYEGTYERCNQLSNVTDGERRNQNFYWTVPYEDASNGFRQGGLTYMSNLVVRSTPCLKRYYQFQFRRKGAVSFSSSTGRDGEAGAVSSVAAELTSEDSDESDESGSEVKKTVRTYFPETWLWDLVTVDEDGHEELEVKVPDTITQWIGNAVCLSKEDGLGISPPASLTAFQPFFVSMSLPYSVIRREKLRVPVTVSNYQSECMAVRISMNSLENYKIIGKPSSVKCVCGQDTATQKFTIDMKEIGDVNISISAEIIDSNSTCPPGSKMTTLVGTSDTVIRPVIVEPEGAPREYTVSDFVCMTQPDSNDGSGSASEDYSLPLPTTSLIPQSDRGYMKVVGDIMGPALSNLDSLIRMPYGCGEQTMVAFAPNIFVLKYLEAINKDKPDIRTKAIQYMKSGYMRELTYAHKDQSYSAFGNNKLDKPGSMWLTAFVVKCFGLARPYIFIDKKIQQKSITFFTRNQDKDGCFPQIGMVHSKYMQGGFGQNTTNKAALTAFVAIAMMEAGVDKQEKSLSSAFDCISKQSFDDAYTTSIVTYAQSLYNPQSSQATVMLNKLKGMAKIENGLKYWKANENEPETPEISFWWYRPRSADTETTAYALLALLKMTQSDSEKIQVGLPIVRWLSTQRTTYGGFGSTQDTVMGLQALAEYASLIYSDGIQASIRVKEKSTGTQVASFEVNGDNSFVEFLQKLPRVTDLSMTATGKGCFLIQTNVRYNIDKPDTQRQAFFTKVSVFRRRGAKDSCKFRSMRICTRYNGEGGVSNMAIVSVKMVSGWEGDQLSLKNLMKNEEVGLARYEVDKDGTAQLYFEQLDNREKCFKFDIEQKFEVKNTKDAVVTTYDYYKTELRQERTYKVWPCRRPSARDRLRPIIAID